MRVLIWHVHGGWTDAFVRGGHDYLLPVDDERGPWGLGRGGRDWPASAVEVPVGSLRDEDIDVVVLQRPAEIDLTEELTGRRPGLDLPAVFLEHNTPKPEAATTRHPLADRRDIPIVHVTHFNQLYWDCGSAPTIVIEHGIVDPGLRYTGELERMAVVTNEPVRRGRIVGTDLLPAFLAAGGIDLFGIGVDGLPQAMAIDRERLRPVGDLPPALLQTALPVRRVYLHLPRWTSLGLSLLEAMHLGMPVVALQATEVSRAVPPGAGFVSTNLDELVLGARLLLEDPDTARRIGAAARDAALARYGLDRFLREWDTLLADVSDATRRTGRRTAVTAPARPEEDGGPHAHRNGL
jgi:hypothetical protein